MSPQDLADHVRETFSSELNTIRDEELRDKVVRTWVRAMTITGATDLARDLPMNPKFSNMQLTRPAIGLEHVRAVVRLSEAIADAEAEAHYMEIDRDVVIAGALLHDVGKLLERAPAGTHPLAGKLVRHPFSGVELGVHEGVPTEVLHIIAYHSVEGHRIPRTLECYIVYEADLLSVDALDRRELGISRAEQNPYIYVPRPSKK